MFPAILRRNLVVAAFVALTLLTALAGLYWAAFHRRVWFDSLPDTENALIGRALERLDGARLRRPAVDSNDSGVPDWYEVMKGLDLRKDAMQPGYEIRDRAGFVFLGERTRIRLELALSVFYDGVRWPQSTELLISAGRPILLPAGSPEDTPPTVGPLRLTPTREGSMECDVLCLQTTDVMDIRVTHARSGYLYNQRLVTAPFFATGWRLPAVRSRIEPLPVDPSRFPTASLFWARKRRDGTLVSGSANGTFVRPHLVWEPLPAPDAIYLLQVARANAPDEWYGFKETDPGAPPSELIEEYDRLACWGYKGPLRYRVIPVSKERPPGR